MFSTTVLQSSAKRFAYLSHLNTISHSSLCTEIGYTHCGYWVWTKYQTPHTCRLRASNVCVCVCGGGWGGVRERARIGVYICVYVCARACVCTYMRACMCVCAHVRACVCACARARLCFLTGIPHHKLDTRLGNQSRHYVTAVSAV